MWPPTSTTARPLHSLVNPVNNKLPPWKQWINNYKNKTILKLQYRNSVFSKKFRGSDSALAREREIYCRRTHDWTVTVDLEMNADDLLSSDLLIFKGKTQFKKLKLKWRSFVRFSRSRKASGESEEFKVRELSSRRRFVFFFNFHYFYFISEVKWHLNKIKLRINFINLRSI